MKPKSGQDDEQLDASLHAFDPKLLQSRNERVILGAFTDEKVALSNHKSSQARELLSLTTGRSATDSTGRMERLKLTRYRPSEGLSTN